MKKVTEKDVTMFAFEFLMEVLKINEDLLVFSNFTLRWEDKGISFDNVILDRTAGKFNIDDLPDYIWTADETTVDINDLAVDESIPAQRAAVLLVEGDLYETLYNYEGMGAGGKKAEKLYYAMNSIARKYGMLAALSCTGMIALYAM